MEDLLSQINLEIDNLIASFQAEQHWQYMKPVDSIRAKIAQLAKLNETEHPLQTPDK